MCAQTIKNYTPHTITVYAAEDVYVDATGVLRISSPETTPLYTYMPEKDGPARAEMSPEKVGMVNDIPIYRITYGKPVNLPEYKEGVYLVVSALTAQAAQRAGRKTDDLLIPSRMVYSSTGDNIVGCCGFSIL